ncbi:MAG: helix-turn-helix domain-containing protein [Hyphomicrobiaceae bacterium]|nr:helix-turn-helix domain-containing protein [Hyphomicrobiaceae bacterium]
MELPTKSAFTVSEVVQRSGLGRDSIYAAIREGRLFARKAGRRTLILRADLEIFLASLPKLDLRPTQSADVSASCPPPVRGASRGGC